MSLAYHDCKRNLQLWLLGISQNRIKCGPNMSRKVASYLLPCGIVEQSRVCKIMHQELDGNNWRRHPPKVDRRPGFVEHWPTSDEDVEASKVYCAHRVAHCWFGVLQMNMWGFITQLDLSARRLRGKLPTQIGNLVNLRLLSLTNNHLTGPIPSELGNLRNLWSLTLDNNYLTGPVPKELGNLVQLSVLFISHNRLTGPNPMTWFRKRLPRLIKVQV